MITLLSLLIAGIACGLVMALWAFERIMRIVAVRIWLSDRINWSNNRLPANSFQIVRHGKWLGSNTDFKDMP